MLNHRQSISRSVIFIAVAVVFFPSLSLRAQTISYTIDSLTFQNLIDFDGGACGFRFSDVNRDGNLDILSVGDHGSPFINTQQHGIMVFFGNGTGSGWTLTQTGDLGYGGIAVGDVNNDGFEDVGYGIHHNYSTTDLGDQVLEVALGDGTGMNWTPFDDTLGLQGQTYGMFGTDFADIDNDGLLDIGSNSFGCCDGLHVHRNTGTGTWPQTFGFTGGNSNEWFQFGDIDNDGFMDFAAARQGGTVYFGDGTSQFTLHDAGLPASGIIGYDFVQLADLDGDASLELGFCYNGGVFVYKWNTSLQIWQNISGNLPPSGSYYVMRIADMNNDGFKDVAAFSTGMFSVFAGYGGMAFSPIVQMAVPNLDFPRYAAIADVDHSGTMDVLMFARFPVSLFTSINKLYLFLQDTVPAANTITGISPAINECYPDGSVRWINWISAHVPGISCTVTLELSTSGGTGTWDTLATGIPDNGYWQWQIPAGLSSSYSIIRYSLTDSSGTTLFASAMSPPFNIGCHAPTSISDHGSRPGKLTAWPNPASDEAVVHFPEVPAVDCPVWLCDLSGQEVMRLPVMAGQQDVRVNLSALWPGAYMVRSDCSTSATLLLVIR